MLMMLASWLANWRQSLGQLCKRLELRGRCGQNSAELMLMMLASWPITGADCSASVWGRCGQNNAQLMLMMLASWLAKSRSHCGSLLCTRLGRAVRPEQFPPDDARLLARQMAPVTGAVCSASVWSFGGRCGQNNAQLAPITGAVCCASVWSLGGGAAKTMPS